MSHYLKSYSTPSTFLFKDTKYSLLLTIKYFNSAYDCARKSPRI